MSIRIKRAYDRPEADDGVRILVERLWPRGLSKKDAQVDNWLKDAAPSTELRKWFSHDPSKWEEFKRRYYRELDRNPDALNHLLEITQKGDVTFVYSSREERFNSAHALKEYLDKLVRS
jgi:uncharacterized protein YeaO (DUF488 family)